MANLCDYDLYATGSKEALDRFGKMMRQDGDVCIWNSMYCADMTSQEPVDNGDGTYTQHFSSATRWSVQHGMVDRPDGDGLLSLPGAARMLGLEIRIWSTETGCCFAEFITIGADGGCMVECEDYHEIGEEDLADFQDKSTEDLTTDDLVEYLEGLIDGDDLEALNLDSVLCRLKAVGWVSIGGFAGHSDFPLS